MRELDKIAEDLFDKIRSRFENVSVGDERAKSTDDPARARFFNFDYISQNGDNFGNITISLISEGALKIYFSKNITDELEEDQLADWYDFLRGMRYFAKRNLLTFDTRDITRSNLQIRDLQQIGRSDSAFQSDEIKLKEGRLHGTSRSSYQTMGPVKLIVRHTNNVDESVRGSRTRNIESIFVETHLGERFLLPFRKLTPARAMARHISEGGQIHDEIGQTIVTMVTEMSDLSVFVRNMRHRTFEDAETAGMVEASVERYNQLHGQLTQMRGSKGYRSFCENFKPDTMIVEDDVDLEALKERFVKKIFDDRLSEALPYVYRAYQQKKMAMENNYVAEFENWTKTIAEGTWDTPEGEEEKEELRRLMDKPINAGNNGDEAIAALDGLIGSDSLFDEFYEASKSEQGRDTDVRPLIIEWLKSHGFETLAQEFEQNMQQQTPAPAPAEQPAAAPEAPAGTQSPVPTQQPAGAVPPQPARESVDRIRTLAGLTGLRRL